jgi:hypothetical protein
MRPQDEAHAKARAMIEGPVLAPHAARRSIHVAWQRPPKARLVLALEVPMLPNKPRGIRRADDRRARDASFGSCVQVHHGATCRRPMVRHDVLQSLVRGMMVLSR